MGGGVTAEIDLANIFKIEDLISGNVGSFYDQVTHFHVEFLV